MFSIMYKNICRVLKSLSSCTTLKSIFGKNDLVHFTWAYILTNELYLVKKYFTMNSKRPF